MDEILTPMVLAEYETDNFTPFPGVMAKMKKGTKMLQENSADLKGDYDFFIGDRSNVTIEIDTIPENYKDIADSLINDILKKDSLNKKGEIMSDEQISAFQNDETNLSQLAKESNSQGNTQIKLDAENFNNRINEEKTSKIEKDARSKKSKRIDTDLSDINLNENDNIQEENLAYTDGTIEVDQPENLDNSNKGEELEKQELNTNTRISFDQPNELQLEEKDLLTKENSTEQFGITIDETIPTINQNESELKRRRNSLMSTLNVTSENPNLLDSITSLKSEKNDLENNQINIENINDSGGQNSNETLSSENEGLNNSAIDIKNQTSLLNEQESSLNKEKLLSETKNINDYFKEYPELKNMTVAQLKKDVSIKSNGSLRIKNKSLKDKKNKNSTLNKEELSSNYTLFDLSKKHPQLLEMNLTKLISELTIDNDGKIEIPSLALSIDPFSQINSVLQRDSSNGEINAISFPSTSEKEKNREVLTNDVNSKNKIELSIKGNTIESKNSSELSVTKESNDNLINNLFQDSIQQPKLDDQNIDPISKQKSDLAIQTIDFSTPNENRTTSTIQSIQKEDLTNDQNTNEIQNENVSLQEDPTDQLRKENNNNTGVELNVNNNNAIADQQEANELSKEKNLVLTLIPLITPVIN